MIIAIDKGHGRTDPGAIGYGMEEAILTGKIGNNLIKKLAAYNVDILSVPRSTDLNERCKYANENGADVFLSIHVNAGGGTGFESYIHPTANVETRNIQNSIHFHLGNWFKSQGFRDRGKKAANYAVLRETVMPAVLLECLFIDAKQDAEWLMDSNNLDRLANEIAYVLAKAFELKPSAGSILKQVKNLVGSD